MDTMIYKLNLPPLEQCILNGVKDRYLSNKNLNYFQVPPAKLFKPGILKLNDVNWVKTLIFHKPDNLSSTIHTDITVPGKIAWGINWIYNGYGLMEYWEPEDFNTIVTHRDAQGFKIFVGFREKCPPRLTYWLEPGAYLVNVTGFHKATGFKDRYCISIRAADYSYSSWDTIVKSFDNLIIPTDLGQPIDK